MVSPANTYIGLTHAPALPGEPQKYYPTGKRNYARVVAADDFQGSADVLLAKQLKTTPVFVINDKEAYGFGIASAFRNVAKAAGVKVVGFTAWDPKAASYQDLATKIQNSGAKAVFLGGLECENGGKLIKDLRSGLAQGRADRAGRLQLVRRHRQARGRRVRGHVDHDRRPALQVPQRSRQEVRG